MNMARVQAWSRRMGGFRAASVVLMAVIIIMLVLWQPWLPNIKATDRTISVTGNATITAVPDQYVFSPSYDFSDTDKQAALDKLTAKSSAIVAKLKQLGVADKDIKTNASGYYNYGYYVPFYQGGDTYTLTFTVTVHDAKVAQKVQDYLVSTSPTGDVTPSVSFSTTKQKELQTSARNEAEQDARKQADQSANNLKFTIIAVKSVVDSNTYSGGPIAYDSLSAGSNVAQQKSSLTVEPGQNDLTYSVQVVYYIR